MSYWYYVVLAKAVPRTVPFYDFSAYIYGEIPSYLKHYAAYEDTVHALWEYHQRMMQTDLDDVRIHRYSLRSNTISFKCGNITIERDLFDDDLVPWIKADSVISFTPEVPVDSFPPLFERPYIITDLEEAEKLMIPLKTEMARQYMRQLIDEYKKLRKSRMSDYFIYIT